MTLHVDRVGEGPDLALLHGWGLNGGVWDRLASVLASRWRLHVVDLPGHGHSRAVPVRDLDAMADAVADVLPARFSLCGWSLGALVALRLVRRHPVRVQGLALVSATPSFIQREDWTHALEPRFLESFTRELASDADESMRRFLKLNALGGPRAREFARELACDSEQRGPPAREALAAGLALLRDTDLRAQVQDIAAPTVVIHGSRDALVPVTAGRWLAGSIRGARLFEIKDASHIPFASHSEPVSRALESLHG